MERVYRRRSYPARKSIQKSGEIIETIKHNDDIPLPNKREDNNEVQNAGEAAQRQKTSIFAFLRKNIHFEEIILIALIFILLDEGIDDEFLLIILIYILIT
jgi:hypothetical protein